MLTALPLLYKATAQADETNMKPGYPHFFHFVFLLHFSVTVSSLLQAVNELLESLGAPLEIVDGFVSSIAVTIPWQALLTDHCTLEVSGLQITCRPKYRTSKFLSHTVGLRLSEGILQGSPGPPMLSQFDECCPTSFL